MIQIDLLKQGYFEISLSKVFPQLGNNEQVVSFLRLFYDHFYG